MAFIPNTDILRVGDRISLSRPIDLPHGTFTVGHKFRVYNIGPRGVDIEDEDGRVVVECGHIQHTFVKLTRDYDGQ